MAGAGAGAGRGPSLSTTNVHSYHARGGGGDLAGGSRGAGPGLRPGGCAGDRSTAAGAAGGAGGRQQSRAGAGEYASPGGMRRWRDDGVDDEGGDGAPAAHRRRIDHDGGAAEGAAADRRAHVARPMPGNEQIVRHDGFRPSLLKLTIRDSIRPLSEMERRRLGVLRNTDFHVDARIMYQHFRPTDTTSSQYCNLNQELSSVFDRLETFYELKDHRGTGRALARQAAAVFRCLPFTVKKMDDLEGLPFIDGAWTEVVGQVLAGKPVKRLASWEQYELASRLRKLPWIGMDTAMKFCAKYRSMQQVVDAVKRGEATSNSIGDSWLLGILFHTEFEQRIRPDEAHQTIEVVRDALREIDPELTFEVTGGYRRGNNDFKDLDFLITHPIEGAENGVLTALVDNLIAKGFMSPTAGGYNAGGLRTRRDGTTLQEERGRSRSPARYAGVMHEIVGVRRLLKPRRRPKQQKSGENLDHLEKFFGFIKIGELPLRRIDLIVASKWQYAFALLGWSGTRMFERWIRRYAARFCGIPLLRTAGMSRHPDPQKEWRLGSCGLLDEQSRYIPYQPRDGTGQPPVELQHLAYDESKRVVRMDMRDDRGRFVPLRYCESEEEIFETLGLPFVEPTLRHA